MATKPIQPEIVLSNGWKVGENGMNLPHPAEVLMMTAQSLINEDGLKVYVRASGEAAMRHIRAYLEECIQKDKEPAI